MPPFCRNEVEIRTIGNHVQVGFRSGNSSFVNRKSSIP